METLGIGGSMAPSPALSLCVCVRASKRVSQHDNKRKRILFQSGVALKESHRCTCSLCASVLC